MNVNLTQYLRSRANSSIEEGRIQKKVDFFQTCQRYGKQDQMFSCDECKETFHPSCITRYLPTTKEDPSFKHFICPTCAVDKYKRETEKKRCKQ